MDPFPCSSSVPGDGLSGASSERPEYHSAVGETCPRTTWFRDTFGEEPYPALEKLAPHRSLLVDRLDGILPASVLMRIKHAQTGWDGIDLLARFLSAPNPSLQAAMDRVIKELPDLQKELQTASSIRASGSIPPAAVFAEPPICEGRDDLVAKIVAGVTGHDSAFRSVVLHGVGGIGKSTVALEVLNHLEVVGHFRGRRFFVGCEDLSTVGSLIGHLATRLAIDTEGQDITAAICQFGTSSPTLLVLDNFEDVWNADGPAAEHFLSSIATVNGFNLIVTKRGSSNLRLPRTRSFPVDTLDSKPALRAFIRHAGRDFIDGDSDQDLRTLVDRLEGYPLALMLLAHQYDAFSGTTSKQLLATYERERSECLKRGKKDGRQTSLRASVELSLASEAMSTMGAKELCFLLSSLPDGAEDKLVDAFLARLALRFSDGPSDRNTIKRAVVGAGLASVSAQGLLQMLAPLRELFASPDAIAPDVLVDARLSVHEYTFMLVELSGRIYDQPSAQESVALRRRVIIQLGNLTQNIKDLLTSEKPPELDNAVQIAAHLAHFIDHTVPFVPEFLSIAINIAHSHGLVRGEAECEEQLGSILAGMAQFDAASHFRRALSLYGELKDRPGEARTSQELGDLARHQGDLAAAQALLSHALAIHKRISNRLGEANCLESLGGLALQRHNMPEAQTYLNDALVIHKEIGERPGEANTLQLLGHLAWRQSDHTAARARLSQALAIHRNVGNRLGEANSLQSLGDLALDQHDLENARTHLRDALLAYNEIGNWQGKATTLESLGDVALEKDDSPTAQLHLEHALAIYKESPDRIGEAKTLASLGDLALRQRDLSAAQVHLDDALAVYEQIGDQISESDTLRRLGDLAFQRRDISTAQMHLNAALALSTSLEWTQPARSARSNPTVPSNCGLPRFNASDRLSWLGRAAEVAKVCVSFRGTCVSAGTWTRHSPHRTSSAGSVPALESLAIRMQLKGRVPEPWPTRIGELESLALQHDVSFVHQDDSRCDTLPRHGGIRAPDLSTS